MKKTPFYFLPKALFLVLALALTNCDCKEDDPEPAQEKNQEPAKGRKSTIFSMIAR